MIVGKSTLTVIFVCLTFHSRLQKAVGLYDAKHDRR